MSTPEIDEVFELLDMSIDEAHDSLKKRLSQLRTGRASADMLDSIRVDYYGSMSPISQMASVTVPEARLLMIKPYEKGQIANIERAILQSPLDLNPQNDGVVIRIPIPMLTEERRKEIAKLAGGHGEDCRVALRNARRDARGTLDQLKKDGDAGEDEVKRALDKVDELAKAADNKVKALVEKKEKEIMSI